MVNSALSQKLLQQNFNYYYFFIVKNNNIVKIVSPTINIKTFHFSFLIVNSNMINEDSAL